MPPEVTATLLPFVRLIKRNSPVERHKEFLALMSQFGSSDST
jgi:hypothetical protein